MNDIEELRQKIEKIKERNVRVEADKAWEKSEFRILFITIITYVIASLVLYFIGVANFLLAALVPTIGYLLSTQSLPFIKRWWIKRLLKKEKSSMS